jgi:hypothetical protein
MMPVPIFLIEFAEKNGRVPRLDELTYEQRLLLLDCAELSADPREAASLRKLAGPVNKD